MKPNILIMRRSLRLHGSSRIVTDSDVATDRTTVIVPIEPKFNSRRLEFPNMTKVHLAR